MAEVEMIKCQECQEDYTADGSNPVLPIVLDCGHDICRDCGKKKLSNNGILCCPDTSCKKKHESSLDSSPTIWSLIKRNINKLTSGRAHPSVNNTITLYLKFSGKYAETFPLNIEPTATVGTLRQDVSAKLGSSLK
ncbi:unnamed protein product, partial [Meganyctiphanes norvegica]